MTPSALRATKTKLDAKSDGYNFHIFTIFAYDSCTFASKVPSKMGTLCLAQLPARRLTARRGTVPRCVNFII